MAIYHYSAKVIGRSTGRSVTAAAAYRAGVDIHDSRTGENHRYGNRGGVIESEIYAPEHAPDWVHDRAELWNTIELTEKRKDAQLAREVEISLPHELDHEQRRALLSSFVENRYIGKGMIADVSFHEPGKGGDDRNYHAHILLTLRPINEEGQFENKEREWNQKQVLIADREAWAEYLNRELEKVGSQDRVDSRSFEERGIDQQPTKHLGPDATEMERRGEESRIGNENREAENYNRERAELEQDEKIIDLAIEREKRRMALEQKDKAPLAPVQEPERQNPEVQTPEDRTPLLVQQQALDREAAIQADYQNRLELRQLDELRALEAQRDRQTTAHQEFLDRTYDRQAAELALQDAQAEQERAQGIWAKITGQQEEADRNLEAMRLNLEDIERRQQESMGNLDREAQARMDELQQRHDEEMAKYVSPAPPEPEATIEPEPVIEEMEQDDTEDMREYTPDAEIIDPYYEPANDNDMQSSFEQPPPPAIEPELHQTFEQQAQAPPDQSPQQTQAPQQDQGPSMEP